jgi:type VI secretion system protein ImpF
MAEMTPLEKLLPCLLDRLTDDEPDKEQESRSKRVISMQKYRQAVERDLTWLLNTHADAKQSGHDAYDEIPSSVLNYGVQNVAGMTSSNLGIDDMRYQLSEALGRFEPRIIPNTLSIEVTMDPDEMSHRALKFEIRGDLYAQPIPESLFIKTELDLETGKSKLNWGSGG